MTPTDKLADALRNIVNMLRDHPAMQGREYIDLGIAANNALREYDASPPPAQQAPRVGDAVALCREARELQRKHYGDAIGLHLAMIDWSDRAALASHAPAKVGAVTLREVTAADAQIALDAYYHAETSSGVDDFLEVLSVILPHGIPVVTGGEGGGS